MHSCPAREMHRQGTVQLCSNIAHHGLAAVPDRVLHQGKGMHCAAVGVVVPADVGSALLALHQHPQHLSANKRSKSTLQNYLSKGRRRESSPSRRKRENRQFVSTRNFQPSQPVQSEGCQPACCCEGYRKQQAFLLRKALNEPGGSQRLQGKAWELEKYCEGCAGVLGDAWVVSALVDLHPDRVPGQRLGPGRGQRARMEPSHPCSTPPTQP